MIEERTTFDFEKVKGQQWHSFYEEEVMKEDEKEEEEGEEVEEEEAKKETFTG